MVNGVITQNVDGLHLRAGSRRVVDLHGTMDRVRCLTCGQSFARVDIADADRRGRTRGSTSPTTSRLNPDGDVEVASFDAFVIPECTVCGGVLKPDIVFFGEFVPTEKFREAARCVHGGRRAAHRRLVARRQLRHPAARAGRRRKLPIVIINRGVTKGDTRATVKIDAGASETLLALRRAPRSSGRSAVRSR